MFPRAQSCGWHRGLTQSCGWPLMVSPPGARYMSYQSTTPSLISQMRFVFHVTVLESAREESTARYCKGPILHQSVLKLWHQSNCPAGPLRFCSIKSRNHLQRINKWKEKHIIFVFAHIFLLSDGQGSSQETCFLPQMWNTVPLRPAKHHSSFKEGSCSTIPKSQCTFRGALNKEEYSKNFIFVACFPYFLHLWTGWGNQFPITSASYSLDDLNTGWCNRQCRSCATRTSVYSTWVTG